MSAKQCILAESVTMVMQAMKVVKAMLQALQLAILVHVEEEEEVTLRVLIKIR